jgi:hypothetical protein
MTDYDYFYMCDICGYGTDDKEEYLEHAEKHKHCQEDD